MHTQNQQTREPLWLLLAVATHALILQQLKPTLTHVADGLSKTASRPVACIPIRPDARLWALQVQLSIETSAETFAKTLLGWPMKQNGTQTKKQTQLKAPNLAGGTTHFSRCPGHSRATADCPQLTVQCLTLLFSALWPSIIAAMPATNHRMWPACCTAPTHLGVCACLLPIMRPRDTALHE